MAVVLGGGLDTRAMPQKKGDTSAMTKGGTSAMTKGNTSTTMKGDTRTVMKSNTSAMMTAQARDKPINYRIKSVMLYCTAKTFSFGTTV